MLKRILAGGLAVVMACSLFTGCGSSGASSSAGALTAIPEEAKKDVVSYLTDGAITSEETVMTVNGVEIPASAYFYCRVLGILLSGQGCHGHLQPR